MAMAGLQYVTLLDDKRTHLLAPGERTECGLPIPIHGGAELFHDAPGDVCKDCTKHSDKLAELAPAEPEPVVVPEPEPTLAKAEPTPAKETSAKATAKEKK
jgi:hypothetical protein